MIKTVEEQARFMARENLLSDDGIQAIYWFPNEKEVRLIGLESEMPIALDREVHPFYFDPIPNDQPFGCALAMIRPEEFKVIKLPSTWGRWEDAKLLEAVS